MITRRLNKREIQRIKDLFLEHYSMAEIADECMDPGREDLAPHPHSVRTYLDMIRWWPRGMKKSDAMRTRPEYWDEL